jgi:hypothetical protein
MNRRHFFKRGDDHRREHDLVEVRCDLVDAGKVT